MRYLNRACSIVPDDSYVLTLRAQAKLGCHNYESALTDADRVLVFLRDRVAHFQILSVHGSH